ncbi:hypothetical protein ACH5RR_013782 [Cinchona calisaya]|uniref:Uncharacterized protein n=1 Tax=Cinchona calisaya TaxID=153742 RepID=A0ABD3A0Z8_9GENT
MFVYPSINLGFVVGLNFDLDENESFCEIDGLPWSYWNFIENLSSRSTATLRIIDQSNPYLSKEELLSSTFNIAQHSSEHMSFNLQLEMGQNKSNIGFTKFQLLTEFFSRWLKLLPEVEPNSISTNFVKERTPSNRESKLERFTELRLQQFANLHC